MMVAGVAWLAGRQGSRVSVNCRLGLGDDHGDADAGCCSQFGSRTDDFEGTFLLGNVRHQTSDLGRSNVKTTRRSRRFVLHQPTTLHNKHLDRSAGEVFVERRLNRSQRQCTVAKALLHDEWIQAGLQSRANTRPQGVA